MTSLTILLIFGVGCFSFWIGTLWDTQRNREIRESAARLLEDAEVKRLDWLQEAENAAAKLMAAEQKFKAAAREKQATLRAIHEFEKKHNGEVTIALVDTKPKEIP